MADVYYRVSGQPTATFTSCGPGSVNLPIALANAYLDSVPFLAVTGNIPTSQFGRGAFQQITTGSGAYGAKDTVRIRIDGEHDHFDVRQQFF